jgi:hypothetical protein
MCAGGGACVFWDIWGWLAIDTIATNDWWDKYDDDDGAAADFEAAAAADL